MLDYQCRTSEHLQIPKRLYEPSKVWSSDWFGDFIMIHEVFAHWPSGMSIELSISLPFGSHCDHPSEVIFNHRFVSFGFRIQQLKMSYAIHNMKRSLLSLTWSGIMKMLLFYCKWWTWLAFRLWTLDSKAQMLLVASGQQFCYSATILRSILLILKLVESFNLNVSLTERSKLMNYDQQISPTNSVWKT